MPTTHPSIASVGANIRAAREANGYSQDEFAALVGLDRSYYGHIERGKYNLTLEVLFRIARALQREPGDLLPRLDSIQDLPPRRIKRRESEPKNST